MKLPLEGKRTVDLSRADAPAAADDRRITMVAATETPCLRGGGEYGFDEILLCGRDNVDLSFYGSGRAPLLRDQHWNGRQVGVIESAEAGDNVLRATARFSQSAEAQEELTDIRDGIRSCVSVGYRILEYDYIPAPKGVEGVRDKMVVTRWQPMETTLCAIPLDPSSGIGRDGKPVDVSEFVRAQRDAAAAAPVEAPTTPEVPAAEAVSDTPASPAVEPAPDAAERVLEVEPEAPASPAPVPPTESEPVAARCDDPSSVTPAPAEPVLATRAFMSEQTITPETVKVAENKAAQAERERSAAINAMGKKFGLAAEAERACAEGATVQSFQDLVLAKFEERQAKIAAQPSVDMTTTERARYSVGRAVQAAASGWALGNSLEREVHNELVRQGQRVTSDRAVLIPFDMMGRTPTLTTGTGQHLVPQQHAPEGLMPFLKNSLAFAKAGMKVLSGIVGDVDFPAGDSVGSATAPGQNANATESEKTFKNVRATARPLRSYAAFTQTQMNNSSPDIQGTIEDALRQTIAELAETQIMVGTGTAQFNGIDGLSGVGNGDFASGAVSYAAFLNMITVCDNALGLLPGGRAGFVTTRGVIQKGLQTARFSSAGDTPILRGVSAEEFDMDGYPVYRGHLVKKTYPSEASPSVLTGHGCYFSGAWDRTYLLFFGNGVQVLTDPYSDALNGNVRLWISADADWVCPQSKVLVKADNIIGA